MDNIDRDILKLLRRDGRLSYKELGEAVQLSANAVAERVRRLIATEAIRAIRAEVSPAAMGRSLEVQIDVKLRPDTSAASFEKALRGLPQVVDAMLMTGSFDYAVRVACIDQDDLVKVTETLREKAGVQETYSRLILRKVDLDAL
jgi:Lrp/AsnC family transcriptional regulator, leucine-responsive regulatory protein